MSQKQDASTTQMMPASWTHSYRYSGKLPGIDASSNGRHSSRAPPKHPQHPIGPRVSGLELSSYTLRLSHARAFDHQPIPWLLHLRDARALGVEQTGPPSPNSRRSRSAALRCHRHLQTSTPPSRCSPPPRHSPRRPPKGKPCDVKLHRLEAFPVLQDVLHHGGLAGACVLGQLPHI